MTKKIFHSILLVAGTVVLLCEPARHHGLPVLNISASVVKKVSCADELELAAVSREGMQRTEYLSRGSASERYRLTWIESRPVTVLVRHRRPMPKAAWKITPTAWRSSKRSRYGEGREHALFLQRCWKRQCTARKGSTDGSVLRISMSRATAGVLARSVWSQPILVVLIGGARSCRSVLAKSLSAPHRRSRSTSWIWSIRLKMTPMKSSPRCSGASTTSTCRSTSRCARTSAASKDGICRRSRASMREGLVLLE